MRKTLISAVLLSALGACYNTPLFTDPLLDPIAGTYHEVAVLTCGDYRELPRHVELKSEATTWHLPAIDEVVFQNELAEAFGSTTNFIVNYSVFEELIRGYLATYRTQPDPTDRTRGSLEITNVQISNEHDHWVPRTLDARGTYRMRPDGKLELRDVWLGPDEPMAPNGEDPIWDRGATIFVDGRPAGFGDVYCGHVLASNKLPLMPSP